MTETTEREQSAATGHIIERPRLTRLLDETTARVIMLVAPAGYGKTTLARQWLAKRPHAWYQATGAAADVASLGLGLLDAAATVIPTPGTRFRQWLYTRRAREDAELPAALLAEDLSDWPRDAWLGIDDYQCLGAETEHIVDELRSVKALRLLLTSRQRPSWSTSRDVLYGDTYELGLNELAMNDDEAIAVLDALDRATAHDVVAVAAGWPAVIGLASFATDSSVRRQNVLPPRLYAYIAEELYASLAAETRDDLTHLSLLPGPSQELAHDVLGQRTDNVVHDGLRVGFLSEDHAGGLLIHPLLREFLHRKFRELPPPRREAMLHQVVNALLERLRWESAFQVIEEFALDPLLERLVQLSLYDLLDRGLLETISQFVVFGRARGVNSPVLDLAEAELAFREGFHERARSLAETAASELLDRPDLATKAFYRAGHAAYFADAIDAAAVDFEHAREMATQSGDKRRAVWGQFLAALEGEDERAVAYLEEFEAMSGTKVDDVLRVQNGKLHLGMRLGSVTHGLLGADAVANLARDARDPIIRASFWHIYSGALRLSADYEAALTASDTALREIDTFELEFARAHILITRVGVLMGLRRYAAAASTLDEVARIAGRTGDIYIQMSERTNRCRLHLLCGQARQGVEATDISWPRVTSRGLFGEFQACRALALIAIGEHASASKVLANIPKTTRENEALALSSCAHALILLKDSPANVAAYIAASFRRGVSKKVLDPFVFGFRLEQRLPRLVREISEVQPALEELHHLLGGEVPVGGTEHDADVAAFSALTPREAEVLQLIADGKTNSEIAATLFITVPTAKVHVRNILRKLGARTRTEAAVLAVRRQ